MKFSNSFALKIVLVGILALAMLIPLQMEIYALLSGSLILFLLLAVVMYFTRNLNKRLADEE